MLWREFSGFQLVHIQHIVDQGQQMIRGLPDLIAAFPQLLRIIHMVIGDLHHPADAIDRGTDIVAHAPQKIRLGSIGFFRLLCRLDQTILIVQHFLVAILHLSLIVQFSLFALIDDIHRIQDFLRLSPGIPALDDKPPHVPVPAPGPVIPDDGRLLFHAPRQCLQIQELPHDALFLFRDDILQADLHQFGGPAVLSD